MVEDLVNPPRQEPAFILAERDMLEAWLEFHRTTMPLKCEGLDDDQLKRRPVPSSKLSLHGLVRRMAELERDWFRPVLLRVGDAPSIWYYPTVEDSELVSLDEADWEADRDAWQAECAASRDAVPAHGLDATGLRYGKPCSLRWISVAHDRGVRPPRLPRRPHPRARGRKRRLASAPSDLG
jgi:hypothetical protein